MTQTVVRKSVKVVHLIGIARFHTGYTLYRVQTEGSVNIHDVTVVDGKVTSCVANGETCQGFYYRHTCCHSQYVRDLETAREEKRIEREAYREFEFQSGYLSIPGMY